MSFSQPTKVENPALHHYEWKNGKLSWFKKYDEPDKNGKKGENVDAVLPFQFIVLDELTTVTGWHDQSNSGIYSNEVKNMSKQQLIVRAFKGPEIARGLYADIKDTVKAAGGKYTRSIYIAEKMDRSDSYVISQIKFAGAAFGAWLEFTKNHNPESGKFLITGAVEGKKGATVFQVPTFRYGDLNEDDIKAATELDQDLQKYLTRYMDTVELEQDESVYTDDIDFSDTKATPAQIAEFESLKAKRMKPQDSDGDDEAVETYSQVAVNEDPGFSDDDIPPEFR
jgi:hypothetical protein